MKTPCLRHSVDLASDQQVDRIAKHVFANDDTWESSTYYVRDAQGNVMATYLHTTEAGELDGALVTLATYTLSERHIYGSSRLGMETTPVELLALPPATASASATYSSDADRRLYELTNHLGNVLATFTARKLPIESDGAITAFSAHVTSMTDYYPFGSALGGRTVEGGYRYGFNGMEREDDIYSPASAYDFGARMYDGRLGRWWSVDPKSRKQPSWSVYKFGLDNPIMFLDPDGETEFYTTDGKWIGTDGKDNKLIATVTNRKLVKQIKKDTRKGKLAAEVNIGTKAFDKSDNMYVIHADVLRYSYKMLKESMTQRGQESEFANGMCLEGSSFVPMLDEDLYNPGSYESAGVDMSLIPEGDVSIHSHLTGYDKETGRHYEANEPSKPQFGYSADMSVFQNFDTNIIVGENNPIYKQTTEAATGASGWDDSKRYTAINIFDSGKTQKPLAIISGERADKLLSSERGRLGKRFDKKIGKKEGS